MNKASTQYFHRRNHQPLEARKNQNKLLLEEDALIFSLQNEHLSTSSNFTWVHVDLQRVKVRSIALTVAFSEQMCQVAGTRVSPLQGCCDGCRIPPLETGVQPMQASPCVQDLRRITLHPFAFSRCRVRGRALVAQEHQPLPAEPCWHLSAHTALQKYVGDPQVTSDLRFVGRFPVHRSSLLESWP
jgi:hypothetical protein